MADNYVTIVKYESQYRDQLETLVKEMSKALFGTGTANIDDFIQRHWCIYLAIINEKAVGFAGFSYNTYFGFRGHTVGLTYLYVTPEHRNSKAAFLLNLQSGVLSISNNIALEHYYASEHSVRMSRKVKGRKAYETWVYEIDEVMKAFNKLTSKVNIRTD